MPPQKPVYPFTANASTHQSSPGYQNQMRQTGGPQRSNVSLGPPPQQQQQQPQRQYYAKNAPYTPGQSTTNLLPSGQQNPPQPPAGPSNFAYSAPAAQSRGPQRSNTSRSAASDSSSVRSGHSGVSMPSASEKYNLSPDPSYFLSPHEREPDDALHEPDPKRDNYRGHIFTGRGLANLGCIAFLAILIVGLFAGYPIASHFIKHPLTTLGAFNLGGTNGTGQVPFYKDGRFSLIDPETPSSALTVKSVRDGSEMDLVFSDEFNTDNRTFWPGDDPFWEAVDLHYWATNNLEWYSPLAITTKGGSLQISLSAKPNHNLNYQGGMMSTWNKFCFTGGMILTSVRLPGANNVLGLWPAVWTMGNLGRAGYGASLEGMWPYTYDSCDVGVMPNQTIDGQPHLATVDGDRGAGGALSFLPGQKLSRCTCPGEDHPGPIHKEDGSYVGRSAPEIDIFEAQVDQDLIIGEVSQSAQWAPFNYHYEWFNTTDNLVIPNPQASHQNFYTGGALQQATSVVTTTNTDGYQLTQQKFETYGFEYKPGFDDAYISWIATDQVAWTLNAAGMAADDRVKIAARPVPQEPMYIIANLGMSKNFGPVDFDHLQFPAIMSIDWIRVYQPKGHINVGCDPDNFPTMDYISAHSEAYTNPNLTTWRDDYKKPFPKQSLKDGCNGNPPATTVPDP